MIKNFPEPKTHKFTSNNEPKNTNNLSILDRLKNLITRVLNAKDYVDDQNLIAIEGYTIEESLGVGGFGEVFLGKHNQNDEYVAIKVMLPEVAVNKRQTDKFLRELDNMKVLDHPHIVKLQDFGFSDNLFFFTLEYCDGGTLFDLMKKRGKPLEIQEAMDLIFPIFDAIEYAHNVEVPFIRLANGKMGKGKGLVHRDINPNNILIKTVNNKSVVKLADFGLSKAFQQSGLTNVTIEGKDLEGTPQFMSKEHILQFKNATTAMDVWSSVACLYYLLTGYYPRDFSRDKDNFMVILQTNAIPIQQRRKDIPDKLAKLIDLGLQDYPQIHFRNATAFKNALNYIIKNS